MVIRAQLNEKIFPSQSLMIEVYFYERNPKLERVSLHKFESSKLIAPLLGLSEKGLLRKASESNEIHGVIKSDNTFVLHPSVWKVVGKYAQRSLRRVSGLKPDRSMFRKSQQ